MSVISIGRAAQFVLAFTFFFALADHGWRSLMDRVGAEIAAETGAGR